MRAVLCKEFGTPESLVIEEVPDPTPPKGGVVVDVKACSVAFPDLLMIQNQYQFKPPMPFSPGGEVAGTVSAVGEGATGINVGDRVFASTTFGGMAERIAVPGRAIIPIPEGIDFESAASFLYAYGTSHHALKDRADLQPGETMVVLGAAGGVGLAAVELGALMGAEVIAAASSDDKLALCKKRGATAGINYATEDLKTRIRELTGGRGADVVYDAVGGDYAEAALRSTAWEGRFLVIGFTAGIPRIPLNLTLLKGCSIVGVFWGSFVAREPKRHQANVEELVDWWKAGKISPHISSRYPLEEAASALRELADRRAIGKVVVTIG